MSNGVYHPPNLPPRHVKRRGRGNESMSGRGGYRGGPTHHTTMPLNPTVPSQSLLSLPMGPGGVRANPMQEMGMPPPQHQAIPTQADGRQVLIPTPTPPPHSQPLLFHQPVPSTGQVGVRPPIAYPHFPSLPPHMPQQMFPHMQNYGQIQQPGQAFGAAPPRQINLQLQQPAMQISPPTQSTYTRKTRRGKNSIRIINPETGDEVKVDAGVNESPQPSQSQLTATPATMLPPEKVRESYEREMRYGFILTSIAKVLLFGIAGSGKTSVTAIMMGDDPPPVRTSTSLMARPIQVISVLIGQLMEWRKKRPEEVLRIIAEIVRSRKLQEIGIESTASELQETDSHNHGLRSPHSEQVQTIEGQPLSPHSDQIQPIEDQSVSPTLPQMTPKSKSEFDSILEEAVKRDDFLKLVHSSSPSSEPILEQRWLYIIDSGGQPEFHNMLSVFLQNTTACIFVFRIHEELDDCPPVAFYRDGSSVGVSDILGLTNRKIFQQFMSTMRSFRSKKNGDPPRIVLLATHRDKVKKRKLLKLLEKRHKELKAILQSQFKHQLMYRNSYEEFIFTINAKEPEEIDRETANEIREKITQVCPREKMQIPLRWHLLDDRSRRISGDLKCKRKVLSRKEYGEIAESLNIDKKSCEDALEFFHSLNTIFYFPKALPKLVFLDPQILLDKLSELVVESYRMNQTATQFSFVQARMPEDYHFLFHEFAQVTEELLSEFEEHYNPPMFTSKDLVILFEKLLIFGKLNEGVWFVPSLLPYLKKEVVGQYRISKGGALLINFPHGGPQNGIFCSTVSFLLSTDNTSPCPWKVLEESNKPMCLKRNIIVFTVGGFPGEVCLIEEWTHFEVHMNTQQKQERDLWKLVYEAVFCGLKKAAETHHYSDTDNAPQPAIICPKQHIDHPSTLHPATIDCEGNWMCTKSSRWFGKVTTETIPWLTILAGEVIDCSGRQQQERQSLLETAPSLTLREIQNELTEVTDWHNLGVQLGVPKGTLNIIGSNHLRDVKRCISEVVTWWLENAQERSWEKIAQACEMMEHRVLAEKLRATMIYGQQPAPESGQHSQMSTERKPPVPNSAEQTQMLPTERQPPVAEQTQMSPTETHGRQPAVDSGEQTKMPSEVTDSSEILNVDKRKRFEAHDPYGCDYTEGIKLTFDEFQPVEREKYRSHNPSYVMKRHPHGIAVIFRNKNFTSPKLSTLEAADNDEYNLKETFRFLGYKVEIYRDHTAQEIRQTFENIVTVRSAEFANHDSFVCCIISHGAMGKKIFTSDSLTVDLNDDIASKLMDCATLQGKPKLFFIQACRRSGRDGSALVLAGEQEVLPVFRIPRRADIFFGFATSPDFVAFTEKYRNNRSSAYIEILCQTFCENAKCMHLVDMHTMINEKAAVEEHDTDEGFYKQMPEIQHTLRKNVYFFS